MHHSVNTLKVARMLQKELQTFRMLWRHTGYFEGWRKNLVCSPDSPSSEEWTNSRGQSILYILAAYRPDNIISIYYSIHIPRRQVLSLWNSTSIFHFSSVFQQFLSGCERILVHGCGFGIGHNAVGRWLSSVSSWHQRIYDRLQSCREFSHNTFGDKIL